MVINNAGASANAGQGDVGWGGKGSGDGHGNHILHAIRLRWLNRQARPVEKNEKNAVDVSSLSAHKADPCSGVSDWLLCLRCKRLSSVACPIEGNNASMTLASLLRQAEAAGRGAHGHNIVHINEKPFTSR